MAHKILLIDDDRAILDVFNILLTSHNYIVDCAQDIDEAKAHLDKSNYSVVVADLGLEDGEMDGLRVFEYLAKQQSRPMTVVCSGNNASDVIEQALSMGADMFLAKPFVFKTFLKKLDDLLANFPARSWPLPNMEATEGANGVQHSDCR